MQHSLNLRRGLPVVAIAAGLALSGCGYNRPIMPAEVPVIKAVADGPPTLADLGLHDKIVARCDSVVAELRGRPFNVALRRLPGNLLGGGVGGAGGAEAYNRITSGGGYSVPGLGVLYGFVSGVTGIPGAAAAHRDQNWNHVFTCTRDGEVSRVAWYTRAEISDPALRQRLDDEFAKARRADGSQDPAFWPSVPTREERRNKP